MLILLNCTFSSSNIRAVPFLRAYQLGKCAVDLKVQYKNRNIAKERKVNKSACVLAAEGEIKETKYLMMGEA